MFYVFSEEDGVGPNVEHALGTSPTTAIAMAEPRKVTIGGRKPAAKKGGVSISSSPCEGICEAISSWV